MLRKRKLKKEKTFIAAWVTANQPGTLTTVVVATAPGKVAANLYPSVANAAIAQREQLETINALTKSLKL